MGGTPFFVGDGVGDFNPHRFCSPSGSSPCPATYGDCPCGITFKSCRRGALRRAHWSERSERKRQLVCYVQSQPCCWSYRNHSNKQLVPLLANGHVEPNDRWHVELVQFNSVGMVSGNHLEIQFHGKVHPRDRRQILIKDIPSC